MGINKEFQNKIARRIYYHVVTSKKIPPKKVGVRRIYLFGAPEYLNYGDIAIFAAELNFLNENLPEFEIITIPDRFVAEDIFVVKKMIDDNDIIALQGGGNMGDVWPFVDMLRQDVIRMFGNRYRIICFPQSISYSNSSWADGMRQTLSNCVNISLFARDFKSFDIMKKIFPGNVKCFLAPDIVMSLNKVKNTLSRDGVLFLMRKDKEKLENPEFDKIKNYVNKNYQYRVSDTIGDTWYRINDKTANKRVDQKLKELQTSKLIITDRLHGMIFSCITNTPVLVFDNNNHKIKNFYNTWLKGKDNSVFFVNNSVSDKAIKFINDMMIQNIKTGKIDLDYSSLRKEFLS